MKRGTKVLLIAPAVIVVGFLALHFKEPPCVTTRVIGSAVSPNKVYRAILTERTCRSRDLSEYWLEIERAVIDGQMYGGQSCPFMIATGQGNPEFQLVWKGNDSLLVKYPKVFGPPWECREILNVKIAALEYVP